jgi:hypothetical protein
MGSLFQGEPQTASSYVNTTTELPKWQQDAIFNSIQLATNVANRPYTSYPGETVAGLTPQQQKAYEQVNQNVGAWQPNMNYASSGLKSFADKGTAAQLEAGQAQYLQPNLGATNLYAGQNLFGQAAAQNIPGAAQPLLNMAQDATGQSLSERAMTAANPFLTAAGQTSASQVNQYMSPYQQGVLDVIAKQGARNLSENLLPQVSDSFIKAGQFGSNRMGEFGSRALRDTQEAVLNQQAKAAQEGYGQALSAAQGDLSRQGQLAGTAGNISSSDLSRILQGGAQYGNLGQMTGQLTAQQMQNLASLGQMQTGAGQAQQQFGLSAESQQQQAQAQDYTREMAALQGVSDTERQAQALRTADSAALESAGLAQQRYNQQLIDANVAKFNAEKNYPQQQLDWLSTQIRGLAPLSPGVQTQTGTTTGATYSPSPLSQLATGIYTAKGLASI